MRVKLYTCVHDRSLWYTWPLSFAQVSLRHRSFWGVSTFIPLKLKVWTVHFRPNPLFQLTSALCMIAVSIDRAILIYLSRPLTRNQAWGVCVGIWILSYTITIPTLIHSKVHNQNKYKEQVISKHKDRKISLRKPHQQKRCDSWEILSIPARERWFSAVSRCVIIKLYQLHDIITW